MTAQDQIQPTSCFCLTYESECLLHFKCLGENMWKLFSPTLCKYLHNILDFASLLTKPKTCAVCPLEEQFAAPSPGRGFPTGYRH